MPAVPDIALATIKNVEIARPGPARLWKGGERNFTEAELRSAVEAAHDPEIGSPKIKLAHVVDGQYDGRTEEPAWGSYENLRWDEAAGKVVADISGTPLWLAKVLPTFFPRRSFEASENVETSKGRYALAFRAIGSLGIKAPAIKGLADLQHWATAEMPAGVTLAAAEGTDTPAWGDTDVVLETATSGGATTVDIRETLGLPKEATEEQVQAKLAEVTAAGSPEALQKIKDDALAEGKRLAAEEAAAAATAAEEAEKAKGGKAPVVPDGMSLVDNAALTALKDDAAAGRAARDQQNAERQAALVDRKIGAGALVPASREGVLATLQAGAIDEATIEALADGVFPTDGKPQGKDDKGADLQAAGGVQDDAWMLPHLTDAERAAFLADAKGA